MSSNRRRFTPFLVVALALHAIGAFVGARVRPSADANLSTADDRPTEIEITTAEAPPPAEEAVAKADHLPPPEAPQPERARRHPGRGGEGAASTDEGSGADLAVAGGTGDSDAGVWRFSALGSQGATTGVDIGLDGGFALRFAATDTSMRRPKSSGGVLESLADHHDLHDGTAALTSAAAEAARRAPLGNFTSAVWEVDADANGNVTRVRIASATSDVSVWESIAKDALQGVIVAPGKGPNGFVVTFQVDIADSLKSGARSAMPSVAPSGIGVGGQFDLADIGDIPHRVSHAHVLSVHAK